MNFYVATLFPDLIRTAVNTSITGRAISNGVLSVETINIRDYSVHGTKRVDDYPYGGGAGMVMEAEPGPVIVTVYLYTGYSTPFSSVRVVNGSAVLLIV